MLKSRQRKKPRGPTQSKRFGSPLNLGRYGGDPAKAQLIETLAAEFGELDPDFKRLHALWCERSDTCRTPYAGEMTLAEEKMLDMIIWASTKGGLIVPMDDIFEHAGDDSSLSRERIEALLGGLAKAGIVGWEPGAASVELRPREKQA